MNTTKNVQTQIARYTKWLEAFPGGVESATRLIANELNGRHEIAQFIEAARTVNATTAAPEAAQQLMIKNLLDERENPSND